MKKINKRLLALILPSVVLFSACGDVDGDGWTVEQGDCNDDDASINPEAVEVCDGVDQNCNGEVDEGVSTAYYQDLDRDGFGAIDGNVLQVCDDIAPEDYVSNNDDCNDMDAFTQNCHNCFEILSKGVSSESGVFNITPESGNTMSVSCEMTIKGGGWTQLTGEYLATLAPVAGSDIFVNYLYTNNNYAWYMSPSTSYIWNWNLDSYQPVSGSYMYGTSGSTDATGAFDCVDNEAGYWGVGCSNGGGNNYKTFVHHPTGDVRKDTVNGTTTICQDQPDVFNVGTCAQDTQIWVR